MSATAVQELVITRVINAPKKLVFDAFTQEEHLVHWWGPVGLKIDVLALDVRPGGIFHYCMNTPDGNKMYGIFKYISISAPDKIVFTNSFADENANVIKAPFDIDFPLEVLNTWTFEEENGQTTLTLRGFPHNATEEQKNVFISMFASMNQGFGGTVDQLDKYLVSISK